MAKEINILYISLSGNTRDFVRRLTDYYQDLGVVVNSINVREKPDRQKLTVPFVTILPAFLNGGNGRDNGYSEILSPALGHYLAYEGNYHRCYGIIGSGNRNFNRQFALTAKQYAKRFGFPYLTDFELRGSDNDITRIGQLLLERSQAFEEEQA